MESNRELDELLDRALASYVDQEPDPSLRARIMAAAENAPHCGWPIWPYAAAATCVASLLFAFLLYPANRAPQNHAVQDRATALAARPHADSAQLDRTLIDSAHPHMAPATRHRYYRKEPNPPRRSIFLASAPLTEEETTLLRFAQQHPEQAREVLSPPSSGPIHIDPVVIAPVQIAALSASQPDAH